MVVVLPEPDGPMIPRMVPVRTVREMSSTATSSPNRLVAWSTTTAGSATGVRAGRAGCDAAVTASGEAGGIAWWCMTWGSPRWSPGGGSGGSGRARWRALPQRHALARGMTGVSGARGIGLPTRARQRSFSGIANRLATRLRGRGRAAVMAATSPAAPIVRIVPDRPRPTPPRSPTPRGRPRRGRSATPPTPVRASPATLRDAGSATATPMAGPSATGRHSPGSGPGHPGLDRRVDLPVAERAHPGERARCPWPQAVPLSRAWHDRRGTDKFDRMLAFAEALPRIRRRCDHDLAAPACPARRSWPRSSGCSS